MSKNLDPGFKNHNNEMCVALREDNSIDGVEDGLKGEKLGSMRGGLFLTYMDWEWGRNGSQMNTG